MPKKVVNSMNCVVSKWFYLYDSDAIAEAKRFYKESGAWKGGELNAKITIMPPKFFSRGSTYTIRVEELSK